jgi:lipoprotein-anchoring transpeptidase ErfK/SrfK
MRRAAGAMVTAVAVGGWAAAGGTSAAAGGTAAAGGPATKTPAGLSAAAGRAAAAGKRLSNERTITRVATTYTRAHIRARPNRNANRVGRLHFHTEDGPLELYLALRSSRGWVQIRIPGRPNGRTGWVPRTALSTFIIRRTHLVVDKSALRATLFRRGKKIWSSPVGIGAPGTPTPTGRYWIRERLRGDFGTYGPWAFGTAAYSSLSEWPGGGVIGIHGTNQPGLIPGRPSHGCIRVPNPKIVRLKKLMPIGTPLWIRL